MPLLSRAYYDASFGDFLKAGDDEVIGRLSLNSEQSLEQAQRTAWVVELQILRRALHNQDGYLLLEYSIPRMGRRADAVLLLPRAVVVVEFKVGESDYKVSAVDQATDYALDLKNFQKESHDKSVVPVLVATKGPERPISLLRYPDGLYRPVCTNADGFSDVLEAVAEQVCGEDIAYTTWLDSIYSPTPTIVEAAQALYQRHTIEEISRSEAGAENLTATANAISRIVDESKKNGTKSICFVAGVPGAGKTLAGLNIANAMHSPERDEHAVFLSGNGPLVDVLREALARDAVDRARAAGEKLTKVVALSRVKAFVQNVHHFRDDSLATSKAPAEGVAVFDEAQRAWDRDHTEKYMREKKGVVDFGKSEPEFLISVMNRHKGWATVVCLVGGGQEINTGEAGLVEWVRTLTNHYQDWHVFVPECVSDSEYADALSEEALAGIRHLERRPSLHLATSMRSFRAEKVSACVKALLDCEQDKATELVGQVLLGYEIRLTRDFDDAKAWLRKKARGTERYGVVASSEAQRLRPFGVNVKAEIDPRNWFLNGKDDIRSSYYLEDVATEFQIQGLELDWVCVAWDGDLRFQGGGWAYHAFRGTRWQAIGKPESRKYLKNAYRVLLTRARQGMVIFVPEGDSKDHTRKHVYYDQTYEYLRDLGIPELTTDD